MPARPGAHRMRLTFFSRHGSFAGSSTWVGVVVVLAGLLAGCGTPSAPQPPTLNLAPPVRDLRASRTADAVRLSWTVPDSTTDKAVLKGPVTARICRQVGAGGCDRLADQPVPAGQVATFRDALPTALTVGESRLLTYSLQLLNRGGKSAGASNFAYAASGPPPPALTDLHAEVRATGVLLKWQPAPTPTEASVHLHRLPLTPSTAAAKGGTSPTEELLVVKAGTDPETHGPASRALDTGVSFNQSYRYTAERVEEMQLDGRTVSIGGVKSATVTVKVRDVFPPAVPAGLVSATDAEAHAIDLSWTPDSESDLAGYNIYRRTLDTGAPPERINQPQVAVTAPAFRDAHAEPGKHYAYSVSAYDGNGNESQRSTEVEESLPR